MENFIKAEDQILEEDLTIPERYESPELPLDLHAELHARVDRLSVVWRRVMAAASHRAAGAA